MQGAHAAAAQIEIKEQIELAGRVPVPPDRCRRFLRSLRRRSEQACRRRLVEPDQLDWTSGRAGGDRRRRNITRWRRSLGTGIAGRRFRRGHCKNVPAGLEVGTRGGWRRRDRLAGRARDGPRRRCQLRRRRWNRPNRRGLARRRRLLAGAGRQDARRESDQSQDEERIGLSYLRQSRHDPARD